MYLFLYMWFDLYSLLVVYIYLLDFHIFIYALWDFLHVKVYVLHLEKCLYYMKHF